MQERRVLVVVNQVYDAAGGELRAAVNTAEAMAADGVDVTITAPWVAAHSHRTIEALDPRVHRQMFPATRPLARFGGSVRQVWWLWRHVRDYNEVQVHILFALCAVYTIIICALRRVPVLLWPHGCIDPYDLRKHARFKRFVGPIVTRRLLNRCAALLFITSREEQVAVTYGARVRHEVVPLPVEPVDTSVADPLAWRDKHGVPRDASVVLFVGRVDAKKRLPLLVEAVSLMRRRDAHLVVVGDGPAAEIARLHDAVRAHGLAERVHVTGWLEGGDRAAAFAAAAVFSTVSDFENFGLAVVEAMSTGCPTVISDQVYVADDVAPSGAAVVVPRDAAAMAQAFDELIADRAAADTMGKRARELVVREYTPPAVAARLRTLSGELADLS